MDRYSKGYSIRKAEFALEALDAYVLGIDNTEETRQERAEFIILAGDVLADVQSHLDYLKAQL